MRTKDIGVEVRILLCERKRLVPLLQLHVKRHKRGRVVELEIHLLGELWVDGDNNEMKYDNKAKGN